MKTKYFSVIAFTLAMLLPKFAYCDGENFLFYNATTQAGVVAKLNGTVFNTTQTFPNGAFSQWTHVSCTDSLHSLLFYNSATGIWAEGVLDHGSFWSTASYTGLSPGWTNILDAGLSYGKFYPLFYNAANGSGAIGYSPTIRSYPSGSFSLGWTNIVNGTSGLLFYDARTGAGAVAVQVDSGPMPPWGLHRIDKIKTVKSYAPGSFSTSWTHVVSDGSNILFYNSVNGRASLGNLVPNVISGTATTYQTYKSYPAGSFGTWTHIVPAGHRFFFYNSYTGAGALGQIVNNLFTTTAIYPPNTFSVGWSHIVAASFDTPPLH